MTGQRAQSAYRHAIFFASGFAGLIYESIWTQYLRIFLGHSAYAQTLVLAIFMGGMAIGAAAIARCSTRITAPLRWYGWMEAAIGVLALLFHPLFVSTTEGLFGAAFDAHWSGAGFAFAKWLVGASLILPQSILLGATFPLFVGAATRNAPTVAGRSIASLYFSNSMGGALGVLASGFVLVPSFGLFGTIAAAGALNLFIAAVVFAMSRQAAPVPQVVRAEKQEHSNKKAERRNRPLREDKAAGAPEESQHAGGGALHVQSSGRANALPDHVVARVLLAAAFFTGASSFIYEIGWIRMLSLVLGSATHSFELMLSSFVLGLALGGFWIRTRVDRDANRGVLLGHIQIAMGCAALATVPLHNLSFNLVAVAMSLIPKTDSGYVLFNLARYSIASLIMFPAAFCAGMTLPVGTRMLYSMQSHGERAIGWIYSLNTVGAIVGIAFAVHAGLPVFGLEYLVGFGAVIDVLIGAVLLVLFGGGSSRRVAYAAVATAVIATFAVAQTFDPQKLASSVFRVGRAYASGDVVQVAHGKTATITVERTRLRDQDLVSIKTNGKADAAANLNPNGRPLPDQVTTTLLGALPLLIHPSPRQVANIGFGSGLTSETVLADPRVVHLDTVEIEPKVVELARSFDPLNRRVYTDPRSSIEIDDARSFFSVHGKRYDVIVSEPSNPWVSGVAGLFSLEFYGHVARSLNDDGLFAQWLQAYETHPDRVISVLKAMHRSFDDYLVVVLNEIDVLLIGKVHGKITLPSGAFANASPLLREALRRVDVANQADITLRIAGNKSLFQPWLDARAIPANSDYVPYLDANADRDRFFNRGWKELADVAFSPIPIVEVLGGRPPLPTPSALTVTPHFGSQPPWVAARIAWETLFGPPTSDAVPVPASLPPALAGEAKALLDACANSTPSDSGAIERIATRILPYLSPLEQQSLIDRLRNVPCFKSSPASSLWPSLLDAVAKRDAPRFADMAEELLASNQPVSTVRYLLPVAMLGHIRAGEPKRALSLWTRFGQRATGKEPPGLALYLLYLNASSPLQER